VNKGTGGIPIGPLHTTKLLGGKNNSRKLQRIIQQQKKKCKSRSKKLSLSNENSV
jgi:hypothetical protein